MSCKKFVFLLILISVCSTGKSQELDTIFLKLKERQNEKQFYNNIFRNPAQMSDFGKYQLSDLKINYTTLHKNLNLVQKPDTENKYSILAKSYYPLNQKNTVWGVADYTQSIKENIHWNESIDFNIIAPYITADSVGGNLKQENYHFSGGFSHNTNKIEIGVLLDYKAKLASRNIDPRPKDISSNLKLDGGIKFQKIGNIDIGFNTGIQKYTQSNDIQFFSELGFPPIYHLNGLGNFNNLLKGNKPYAFYDGFGYSAGLQLNSSKEKNLFLLLHYQKLNIDKLVNLRTAIETSQLENTNIYADLIKLFKFKKHTLGIKLSYIQKDKKGTEALLAGRTSIESIIAKNINYKYKNQGIKLNGMYYSPSSNLYLSPYIGYEFLKEENIYPKTYQNFKYLNFGITMNRLWKINQKNIIWLNSQLLYLKNLQSKYYFSNIQEATLKNNIIKNYTLLSQSFPSTYIGFSFNHLLKNQFLIFAEIDTHCSWINKKANYLLSFSTGFKF